ncbi:Ig-like domain-containing protein [Flavobacteriaceae bacterium D16]|nr:Ig-like domain-containing protein [Flavobacteriaceae bacterium D16]
MKNEKRIYSRLALFLGLIIVVAVGCERDYDFGDDAKFAKFGNNPEIFIDGFSGGLEYLPFGGSKFDAFSVDTDVKYKGEAAMRFDVPNAFDPSTTLGFAGAIFPDYGGRDLSGYDALTFWAKATKAETISEIGFGNDFGDSPYRESTSKFLVTKQNLRISTAWTKYIIPIPDPSKLFNETGMFWYAEGPDENGDGYTFWIDELQFEKLGTIAQPQPAIFNGEDETGVNLVGTERQISGTTQTFNLANGQNETVLAAPAYFDFNSSDTDVATVTDNGLIQAIAEGATEITATLGGVPAKGSLELTVGEFSFAPTPPARNAADVISIFSNAYNDVPVDFYNGFFEPFQTTTGGLITIGDDDLLQYEELNFVATGFSNPTVDATQMDFLHIDIRIDEAIDAGDIIRIELVDFGPDGVFGGDNDSGGSITLTSADLGSATWISLDFPLDDFNGPAGGGAFNGLTNRANVAQVVFASDATIDAILVDNIYFYR